MRPASVTSPFQTDDGGTEWIQWEKAQPICGIQAVTKAAEQSEAFHDDVKYPGSDDVAGSVPGIYRPQYNAVLERFSWATKHTGAFSNWTT